MTMGTNVDRRTASLGRLAAAILLVGGLALSVSAADATPDRHAWQLDGTSGAEIVAGLPYFDRGAIVVIPSDNRAPATDDAVTITGEDLPAPVDFIGGHLASGDVDGDGYGDLVTSGRDDSGGGSGVMVLVVIPGGPQGPQPDNAYTVTSDGPGIGGRVIAADLDRDGVADVAAQSGTAREPEVTILWGGEGKLSLRHRSRISAPGQRRFGELMAAGNVDSDVRRELVLAQGGRVPDNESTQRVGGFLTICELRASRKVTCLHPRRITAGAFAMAVGDVAGGSADEVIIGAPVSTRRDDSLNRPAVWMYRGTSSGPVDDPVRLVRGRRGIPGTHTPHSAWGSALAVGDVDRNGKDELVVGAPGEKRGGRLTVLFGARRGPGSTTRDQTIGQGTTGVAGTSERGDGFGAGVSLLDVTGDGLLDLLAGVPGENRMTGGITIIPSGEGRFSTRRSVRVDADDLGLDPKRGEMSLGWVLGQ